MDSVSQSRSGSFTANTKKRKHHLFHAYCSKVTMGSNEKYIVADGSGIADKKGDYERESIYDKNFNLISTHNKKIGLRYGSITSQLFNTTYKDGFHYCGKTMALSQYGNKIVRSTTSLTEEKTNTECQDFLYSLQKITEKNLLKIMPKDNVNYSGGSYYFISILR